MATTYRSGGAGDGSTAMLTKCRSMSVALIGEGLTNLGITAWIADLRASLDRGDLATLGPVDVGHGTQVLSAQDTVRIMLADWTISRTRRPTRPDIAIEGDVPIDCQAGGASAG